MEDIIERETLGIETYMVTYYTSMGFSNQKKKKKRANAYVACRVLGLGPTK